MIAIDTNIAVRYLLHDDPIQAQIAHNFLYHNDCLMTRTVLLETVWVLGSKLAGNLSREQILERVYHLLALPNMFTETPQAIHLALQWYENGMDFADALHLATILDAVDEFATFDKAFVSKAKKLNIQQVVKLLS